MDLRSLVRYQFYLQLNAIERSPSAIRSREDVSTPGPRVTGARSDGSSKYAPLPLRLQKLLRRVQPIPDRTREADHQIDLDDERQRRDER